PSPTRRQSATRVRQLDGSQLLAFPSSCTLALPWGFLRYGVNRNENKTSAGAAPSRVESSSESLLSAGMATGPEFAQLVLPRMPKAHTTTGLPLMDRDINRPKELTAVMSMTRSRSTRSWFGESMVTSPSVADAVDIPLIAPKSFPSVVLNPL